MSTTTEKLIAKYSEEFKKASEHELTNKWCLGELSDRALCIYLAQDLKFFNTSFRLICKTTSECPDDEAMITLAKKIGFFANEENNYFQDCLKLLLPSITDEQDKIKNIDNEIPTTNNYLKSIESKLRGERLSDYPNLITSLWAAEAIYYHWAHYSPRKDNLHWKYQTWIDLHDGQHFEVWCDFLANEVNKFSVEEVEASFKQCLELEFDFFEGCYQA